MILGCNYSFYALLIATIRQADSENLNKLEYVFPEVVLEFRERYNAPGGKLKDD